jgi:hypothetical protein
MSTVDWEEMNKRSDKIHQIWWDFCNHMKQWYFNESGDFDSELMIGYEASERVSDYAKDHSEIVIAYCDDDYFMGSDIVLIPHPEMGITVIYIPQCEQQINMFFLYPNHLNYLIEKLNEVKEKFLIKSEF